MTSKRKPSRAAEILLTVLVAVATFSIAIIATRFAGIDPLAAALTVAGCYVAATLYRRQSELRAALDVLDQKHANQTSRPAPDADLMMQYSSRLSRLEEADGKHAQADLDALSLRLDGLDERLTQSLQIAQQHQVVPVAAAATEKREGKNTSEPAKATSSTDAPAKMVMLLQPIVGMERREPHYFHMSYRLKMAQGALVEPAHFARIAENGGMMVGIDRRVVINATRILRSLRAMNQNAGLICPLSAQTLSGGTAFDTLLALLKERRDLAPLLMFDVQQKTLRRLPAAGRDCLQKLKDVGYTFCLSQVDDLRLDPAKLSGQGFEHIRVPASILLHSNVAGDDNAIAPPDLAERLSAKGITVIASGVDTEDAAARLSAMGIARAQGTLFAPPRPIKPELLADSPGAEQAA